MNQKGSRRHRLGYLWIGIVFVVVLVGLVVIQNRGGSSQLAASGESLVGRTAPAFTLASTQGKVSLSQFRHMKVILYFYEGNS